MSTARPTTSCLHARLRPAAFGLVAIAAIVALFATAAPAGAATPIGLGGAERFAVLAGSGITNTGPTTVTGDIGTFPTITQSGFGSITQVGTNQAGNAVAQQAKTDLTTAYDEAAGSLPATSVADELGGTTLTPGVYNGATLEITGTLTLDTQGDPAAVFVFQSGSTLVTASGSDVVVIGSTLACNVYWQVPSSATLGTGSHLVGTVLASASITATTGATVQGRLLAQTGAVTLDTNTISNAGCQTPAPTTTTTSTPATDGSGGSDGSDGSGGSGGPDGSGTPLVARPATPRTPGPGSPPLAYTGGVAPILPIAGFSLIALGTAALVADRRGRTRGAQPAAIAASTS